MRLLNTWTLELVEFPGDYEGLYAILSHTWEKDEITFQDMLKASDGNNTDEAKLIKAKAGYVKICEAAKVAAECQLRHIWVDTCCIDKTSSAELSEAINSMFRWYKKARVCIVYLADVAGLSGDETEFRNSKWFKRGWTLQELIAPGSLHFYCKDWKYLTHKSSIAEELSVITGINQDILLSQTADQDLSSICIARRMSWASKRSTTRPEDMAYCLMGLFDINMPLLYGEGDKAFQRLQEEIAKRSDDQTLFAW
ncbi:HET-domain-containing protein, partial [Coniochaeta sp. PMI_546]